MKKTYIIVPMVLLLSVKLFAVSETINLGTNPGTLSTALVNTPATVTDLIITGQMDYRDFTFMKTSMTNLANLDMSAATIVRYTDTSVSPSVTFGADSIPAVFKSNKSIKSVKLPSSTVYVSYEAFRECSNLTNIDFGISLKVLAGYTFYKSGLTGALVLPEGLTYIGEGAFHSNQNLTEITIPSTATTIMQGAFAGLSGTTSNVLVYNIYATTPPLLGANVFLRKNVNSVLHVSVGYKSTYETAGSQWAVFSIQEDLMTNTSQISQTGDFNAFVSENILSVKSDKEFSQIKIYSIAGKMIQSTYVNSNNYSTKMPTKGIYLVNIVFNNGATKVIKVIN